MAVTPSLSTSTELHQRCVDNVAWVLRHVETVAYIANVMREIGRDVSPENIKCVPSGRTAAPGATNAELVGAAPRRNDAPVAEAGYVWGDTPRSRRGDIVLYEDQLLTREDIERSLRHELVHAFDDARGYLEPTNCFHHACSEIRAARLSGDCFFHQEAKRGNLNVMHSGRACVRRRAALAVENNPMCRSYGERAVDVVFARCYNDFEPFAAPVYIMGSQQAGRESDAPAA